MKDRKGIEQAAVIRLTSKIHSTAMRAIVVDCLNGQTTPSAGLRQMLSRADDLSQVRSVIDSVTERAANISRSGDNLVRDRADELTQLFVECVAECRNSDDLLARLPAE